MKLRADVSVGPAEAAKSKVYFVCMKPGLMELTRMESDASSHARLRVIWSTAAFDVW